MANKKLTIAEDGFCQDYVSGMDLLTCFRRNYPKDKRADNSARFHAKTILKKDHIANRIKFLKERNCPASELNREVIIGKWWDWANRFEGKQAGIAAMNKLSAEFGVGVDKLVVEDNTGIIDMQRNLFARRLARLSGEDVPPLLTVAEVKEVKSEVKELEDDDYEIVEDDSDAEEEVQEFDEDNIDWEDDEWEL